MDLLKKGIYILLGLSLTIACKSDDEGSGGDSATISNLDFVITEENDNGNAVGVTPSATGATSYSIDFNDPSVSDNSDIIASSGPKATYTYPEESATYEITVTASASNAADVSETKSHTVTFEAATVLADFEDEASLNLRGESGGNVTISVASETGMNGQESKVGVAVFTEDTQYGAFTINPTNYIDIRSKGIITLEYYQSEGVARDILLKLQGTKTVQDGIFDIEVLTTSTDAVGWQTLSFDFQSNKVMGSYPNSALPVILDQYSSMAIFVDFATSVAGTYWFDNINGAEWGIAVPDSDSDGVIDSIDDCKDSAGPAENDGCPIVEGPSEEATAPSHAQADVLSIYSDSYMNLEGTNFNPGWGQTTTYTSETIGNNAVIKYSQLNYQGIEYTSSDVSEMTYVHFDIYTSDLTAIDIFPISTSSGDQISVTKNLTANSWNSIDIPLSEFNGLIKTDMIQFKLVGNPWNESGFGTIWVDNIYFHK